ncbi:hypothetical protein BJ508DRAFT_213928, partial [Ascobolus immersus RN42]
MLEKDRLTSRGLARFVSEYLGSRTIGVALEQTLDGIVDHNISDTSQYTRLSLTERSARRWLNRLGFQWKDVRKNVYIDGHERFEVKEYRKEFLEKIKFLKPFFAYFEDGHVKHPEGTAPFSIGNEGADGAINLRRPIIPVTHDESTVNANDGIRQAWHQKDSSWIRPKGRGRAILAKGIPLRSSLRGDGVEAPEVRRDSAEFLEYGKDNYWDGEKMTDHILTVVVPMLELVYPGFDYLFLFDNATNHCSFAEDALNARRMSWGPGGQQPHLRDGV